MSDWTQEAREAHSEYLRDQRGRRSEQPEWLAYESAPTAGIQMRREYMRAYRAKRRAADPEGYAKRQREYQQRYWERRAAAAAAEKKAAQNAEWAAYLASEGVKNGNV